MSDVWEFVTWSDEDLAKLQRKDRQPPSSCEANNLPSPNDCVIKQTRKAADEEAFLQKHYEMDPPGLYYDEVGDEDWSDESLAQLARPDYPAHKPESLPAQNKPQKK